MEVVKGRTIVLESIAVDSIASESIATDLVKIKTQRRADSD